MQIVENLLKAIDEGEYSIEDLGLSADELDKYSEFLLVSGMATSVPIDTEKHILNPTAVGNALLTLLRRLEELLEESKSVPVTTPWFDLDVYMLHEDDIKKIQTRMIN